VAYGRPMFAAVLIAASSVLVAHLIYPLIKDHCARRRPFDCDPAIASLLDPLDRHSFPSGHAMTAAAAFLPLSAAMPAITLPAIATVILIGWARLAAGHHYPTDVLAGALLGSLIASPGLVWLLY
jgi:undecaprenyl-diphosphatase